MTTYHLNTELEALRISAKVAQFQLDSKYYMTIVDQKTLEKKGFKG